MKREEHLASLGSGDSTTREARENHGQRLANGLGVAQRVEDVLAESRPGADAGYAGAAELLVEVAVGAGARGWRLTDEAVSFGVATDRILGGSGSHGKSFLDLGNCPLNREGREALPLRGGLRPFFFTQLVQLYGFDPNCYANYFAGGRSLVCAFFS